MKNFLEKNIGAVDFSESRIPLSIVASNIANGEKVVLEKGDVANAVMASMSIPGIFIPITIDGVMLVDGGIVENVPITPLLNQNVDVIIAIDVNSKHFVKKPTGITDILLNSFHHTIANATKMITSKADILIQPDLSGYNYHNTDQSAALIEQGYTDTMKALRNVNLFT
jgi:NTE family protein